MHPSFQPTFYFLRVSLSASSLREPKPKGRPNAGAQTIARANALRPLPPSAESPLNSGFPPDRPGHGIHHAHAVADDEVMADGSPAPAGSFIRMSALCCCKAERRAAMSHIILLGTINLHGGFSVRLLMRKAELWSLTRAGSTWSRCLSRAAGAAGPFPGAI